MDLDESPRPPPARAWSCNQHDRAHFEGRSSLVERAMMPSAGTPGLLVVMPASKSSRRNSCDEARHPKEDSRPRGRVRSLASAVWSRIVCTGQAPRSRENSPRAVFTSAGECSSRRKGSSVLDMFNRRSRPPSGRAVAQRMRSRHRGGGLRPRQDGHLVESLRHPIMEEVERSAMLLEEHISRSAFRCSGSSAAAATPTSGPSTKPSAIGYRRDSLAETRRSAAAAPPLEIPESPASLVPSPAEVPSPARLLPSDSEAASRRSDSASRASTGQGHPRKNRTSSMEANCEPDLYRAMAAAASEASLMSTPSSRNTPMLRGSPRFQSEARRSSSCSGTLRHFAGELQEPTEARFDLPGVANAALSPGTWDRTQILLAEMFDHGRGGPSSSVSTTRPARLSRNASAPGLSVVRDMPGGLRRHHATVPGNSAGQAAGQAAPTAQFLANMFAREPGSTTGSSVSSSKAPSRRWGPPAQARRVADAHDAAFSPASLTTSAASCSFQAARRPAPAASPAGSSGSGRWKAARTPSGASGTSGASSSAVVDMQRRSLPGQAVPPSPLGGCATSAVPGGPPSRAPAVFRLDEGDASTSTGQLSHTPAAPDSWEQWHEAEAQGQPLAMLRRLHSVRSAFEENARFGGAVTTGPERA